MAKDTPVTLRNKVIYSVFVRNFSPEGNFEGVRRSLGALLDDAALYARMAAAPDPYGDGHAAERIRAALRETFGRA